MIIVIVQMKSAQKWDFDLKTHSKNFFSLGYFILQLFLCKKSGQNGH